MGRINIIAVVGTDRSGSTLLDKIIGSNPSVISLGEIHRFYNYFTEDHTCTCGEKFHTCPFWTAVLEEIVNEDNFRSESLSILGWKKRVSLLLHNIILKDSWKEIHYEQILFFKKLCDAVLKESKSNFIVDSSKDITRFYLLHLSGLFNIFPIYITRDVEDYIASMKRPQMRLDYERKADPFTCLIRWIFRNTETRCLIRKIRQDYVQLSYKRLVNDPAGAMLQISNRLQVNLRYDPNMTQNTKYHMVGGNYMKFKKLTEVRLDVKDTVGTYFFPFAKYLFCKLNKFFVRNNI